MHVGLNLIFLVPGETGGTETYARELIRALRQEAPEIALTAFVNREGANDPTLLPADVDAVTIPVSGRNRLDWVRGEQLLLPRAAERRGVDLVHSLGNTAPAWGKFRRIVTVCDLHFLVAPESHFGIRAYGMRLLVPLAARTSHRVIAISEATATDIREHLKLPQPIDVTPLGVRVAPTAVGLPEAEIRQRFELGDRELLLSFAAKRPHKNLMRLLQALALIPPERRPVLVLPGYPTPHEAELKAEAARLRLGNDTRFRGWIPPEEAEGLFATAAVFVVPSLFEGFGLPIVEAMARGVPVCCSNRGAMQEVAGDAAHTFDPEDTTGMAATIENLLAHPELRDRLRAAGLKRAATFTWERTARATCDSYAAALAAS